MYALVTESHPGRPPNGWPRVAGLLILSAAGTVTAVLTDGQTAAGVVLPLLPYLPR